MRRRGKLIVHFNMVTARESSDADVFIHNAIILMFVEDSYFFTQTKRRWKVTDYCT